MPPPRPAPSPDQLVTSSDLVRHFGLWQERAARHPLYVLHRGRPRFVLASIETMDALCAPHDAAATDGADFVAVLDGVSDLVLVADGDGRIVASSRAARAHFGALAASGEQLDAVAPIAARSLVTDARARVIASGVAEQLAIPSPTRAGRMLAATLAPMARGVALFAQDGTTEREHADLRASGRALGEALGAAGGMAAATLSARGHIIDPGAALVLLTGLAREALAALRFVALAEIGGRVALGDAIERVLGGGGVEALDLLLLVNRAAPAPVRIGLAPIRLGSEITGAAALIAMRTP